MDCPPATPKYLPTQKVTFKFLARDDRYRYEKPYRIMYPGPLPNDAPRSNLAWEVRDDILVRDVRGHEAEFKIDEVGFCWIHSPTKAENADDHDQTMKVHIEETIQLVREVFNPDRVVCYDYRRRKNQTMDYDFVQSKDRRVPAPPIIDVHVDHSNSGGLDRARRHLTKAECTEYIDSGKYRIQIINTWRPVLPVEDCPLAVCDVRTAQLEDMVPTDRWTPEYLGEIWHTHYNASQMWYWLSHQSPEEVLTFVTFDSRSEAEQKVLAVPHTAFMNPLASGSASPRESVETRMLIFSLIQ